MNETRLDETANGPTSRPNLKGKDEAKAWDALRS